MGLKYEYYEEYLKNIYFPGEILILSEDLP